MCVIEERHGQRFLPHVFHLMFVEVTSTSELCTSHAKVFEQYLDTAALKENIQPRVTSRP